MLNRGFIWRKETPSFQSRKYFDTFCQLVNDYIVEPKEAKASAYPVVVYSSKVASLWVSCDHMHAQLTSLTLAILFASSTQVCLCVFAQFSTCFQDFSLLWMSCLRPPLRMPTNRSFAPVY